jgi:hypothetical protein
MTASRLAALLAPYRATTVAVQRYGHESRIDRVIRRAKG